ncbi:MAG: TrmH family RNA methyltransferase [Bacteroidia bacterium]
MRLKLPHPPKFYAQLHHPTHRQKTGLYLAEGKKLLYELYRTPSHAQVEAILTTMDPLPYFLPSWEGKVYPITDAQLRQISTHQNPEGILIVVALPSFSLPEPLPPTLFLEDIQDPGNVGTLLRLADAFGISWVLGTPQTADFYGPKVVRAAMGATFRLHAQRVSYATWHSLIRSYVTSLAVADLKGTEPENFPWAHKPHLYVGNESRGVQYAPPQASKVYISMPGQAESLNVAVAAGILLYVRSQKLKDTGLP